MSVRERLLTLHLLNKLKGQPDYTKELCVELVEEKDETKRDGTITSY